MKLWIHVAAPVMVISSFAMSAHAQTGYYGAMQPCAYNYSQGQAAYSKNDDISNLQKKIAKLTADKAKKEKELEKAEREMEIARRGIDAVLNEDAASTIYNHMDGPRSCSEYKGYMGPDEFDSFGQKGDEGSTNTNNRDTSSPFSPEEWQSTPDHTAICDYTRPGFINNGVCSLRKFQKEGRVGKIDKCKSGITSYRTASKKASELRDDIADMEQELEYASSDLDDAASNASTEAGCPGCALRANSYTYQPQQSNLASVIANIGLGFGAIALGHSQNKMITENNANIGAVTQGLVPAWAYGMGPIATGLAQLIGGGDSIYGASIGGGVGAGAGSYGCAGNNGGVSGLYGPLAGANGNSMWGNPYTMQALNPLAQMSGGLYLNNPLAAMMAMQNGGIPGTVGGGWGGGLNGGFPGGYNNGLPNFGVNGGFNAGFPGGYNGFPGGYNNGFPGGYNNGLPNFGVNGGFNAGFPGGYNGFPGGYNNGFPGGYNNGFPGGYNNGFGNSAGDLGMMQMQMQMQQLQMQQYQAYAAQQQAYMQGQMQRQQAAYSVDMEIANLIQKRSYIYSGAYSPPSYVGGSGSSGYYNPTYGSSYLGTGSGSVGVVTYPGGVVSPATGSGYNNNFGNSGVTVPGMVPQGNSGTATTPVGTGR